MRATGKPFNIDKKQVYEAYKAVKSKGGAAGEDGQTIEQFEADLKNNLYKIWNWTFSGTISGRRHVPSACAKKSRGHGFRCAIAGREAQIEVKRVIEPDLDPVFPPDSYGYRPRTIGSRRRRSQARAMLEIRLGRI